MSTKRPEKLKVMTQGKRSFVYVPSTQGHDLHGYLRTRGVQSSPPEPSSTGIDCIELTGTTDAKAVQAILDSWS
jgi:hypothetical protein